MKNKRQVSPQKLEANRANAQRSTGPRTNTGKAKSGVNRYVHGIFARRLFRNAEQLSKDGPDYNSIYKGLHEAYSPVGYLENLLLERIATATLRLARFLEYEQKVLGWSSPFEERSVDRLVRYESTVNRQLTTAVKQLETLQEKRKANASELELETDGVTIESSEVVDERSVPTEKDIVRGPDAINLSAGDSQPSSPSEKQRVETDVTPKPPITTIAVATADSRSSHEDYETNPIGSSHFIEGEEDRALIADLRRYEPGED